MMDHSTFVSLMHTTMRDEGVPGAVLCLIVLVLLCVLVWVLPCSNLPCFADLKRRVERMEGVLEKMMEKVLEIAGSEREQKQSKGSKSNS